MRRHLSKLIAVSIALSFTAPIPTVAVALPSQTVTIQSLHKTNSIHTKPFTICSHSLFKRLCRGR